MIDHTKRHLVAPAILLFFVILLLGIFGLPRHANAWVEVLSNEAASTVPLATDSVVALVSALGTAVGVVWLYLVRLAR